MKAAAFGDSVMEEIRVATIGATDQGFVSALAAVGMPTDDLTDEGHHFFGFRNEGGEILGYGGVQERGDVALLRSVVVIDGLRGQGIGVRIASWILNWLQDRRCEEVYMLTTTAVSLGTRCGFRRLERDLAPEPIRDSRQMAALCPASAVLMVRKLKDGTHEETRNL